MLLKLPIKVTVKLMKLSSRLFEGLEEGFVGGAFKATWEAFKRIYYLTMKTGGAQ